MVPKGGEAHSSEEEGDMRPVTGIGGLKDERSLCKQREW